MAGYRLSLERAGGEHLPVVRRGPPEGPLIVLVQPLFEEQNRCRRFLADLANELALRGIETALPDLPATGDHEDGGPFDLVRARAALTAYIGGQSELGRLVALRGGALLVEPQLAPRCYALAPVGGARLLRDLVRAEAVGERERSGRSFGLSDAERLWNEGERACLAGHEIMPQTASALREAAPRADRVQHVGSDEDEIPGPKLWRQADPVRAREMARTVAGDVAAWIGAG